MRYLIRDISLMEGGRVEEELREEDSFKPYMEVPDYIPLGRVDIEPRFSVKGMECRLAIGGEYMGILTDNKNMIWEPLLLYPAEIIEKIFRFCGYRIKRREEPAAKIA